MPETVLKIEGLNAFYQDFQALYDLNMYLNEGEILAFIGSNGAGKTTLLHSISGLISNGVGQVQYHKEDIGALRADRITNKGIALVPEGRQLFQSLSVEENLLVGGYSQRKGPWSLQSVYGLFPMLKQRRNFSPAKLSGGQQQMVAIGRALMSNPDLLLLDEISLGLAPVIIKSIYDALPDIVNQGMSAIIVEQDTDRALKISSRAYCLQEGRISLTGPSDHLSREEISRAYFGIA